MRASRASCTPRGDELAIPALDAPHVRVEVAVFLDTGAVDDARPVAERGIPERGDERPGQARTVPRREETPAHAVLDPLAVALDVGDDRDRAAGHRLEERD